MINITLYDCVEIRNYFHLSAALSREILFNSAERNFVDVSPCGHVISSI